MEKPIEKIEDTNMSSFQSRMPKERLYIKTYFKAACRKKSKIERIYSPLKQKLSKENMGDKIK